MEWNFIGELIWQYNKETWMTMVKYYQNWILLRWNHSNTRLLIPLQAKYASTGEQALDTKKHQEKWKVSCLKAHWPKMKKKKMNFLSFDARNFIFWTKVLWNTWFQICNYFFLCAPLHRRRNSSMARCSSVM